MTDYLGEARQQFNTMLSNGSIIPICQMWDHAKILNCPFCDSRTLGIWVRKHRAFIECGNCGTAGPHVKEYGASSYNLVELAVTYWNKRNPSTCECQAKPSTG